MVNVMNTPENVAADDEFHRECIKDLLIADGVDVTDEIIDILKIRCKDNPFDAPIMYKLLHMTGQI